MRTPLTVGVIGLDPLGLEYADALARLPQVDLRWLCDELGDVPQHLTRRYASARVTESPDDLLADEGLDAVAVALPARPDLVWLALAADKHVFAVPPLAHSTREAADLLQLAEVRGRALVVAEPLAAEPAATRLKMLIESGHLGEVYSLYANRQGLGPVADRTWPFGVDELALILYLLGDDPIEVAARGESYLEPGVVDVAFCFLRFATGISASLHLSWLDPLRLRRLTAIGSRRMAVLDQLAPERMLTVHERRASRFGGPGDIVTPWVEPDDAIRLECERFVAAARGPAPDPTARRALTVVGVLESLSECLVQEPLAAAPPVVLPPRPDLHVVRPA